MMATHSDVGDRIIGETILCNARKIIEKPPMHKSGRHKIQRIVLKDNADATIIKKSRFLTKNPK